MRLSHSLIVLTTGLACALGGQMVWADMYKWVNEDGGVTFSNTPPRDRSRIIEVFPSSEWAQPNTPPVAPAAATQQMEELRVLTDRMERLSRALEDERRFDAAQPVAYPQYTAAAPPMWDEGWGYPGGWNGGGWNGGWWNGNWFGPPFFASAPVVVVGGHQRFPRFQKFHHFPNAARFGPGAGRSHPNAVIRTGGGAGFQPSRPNSGRMR